MMRNAAARSGQAIILALAVSFVWFAPAFAQQQTVIVTAQKREERAIETPISLLAFSGEDLDKAGIKDFMDLATATPGLRMNHGVFRARDTQIGMRGVKSRGGNGGIDPAVALYLDGVFIGRPSAFTRDLLDVESVEILRGPQGTLYGRNASVGAVNIYTRKPTHEFEVFAKTSLGIGEEGYGRRNFSGTLNGGLTDKLAMRMSFYRNRYSGYFTNLAPGGNQGQSEGFGGFAKALYEPNERLDITVGFDYDQGTTFCCHYEWFFYSATAQATEAFIKARAALVGREYNLDGRDNTTDHVVDNLDRNDNLTRSYGVNVRADYERFDHIFSSISAYRFWELAGNGGGLGYPINIFINTTAMRDRTYSQEFRIASPDDQTIEYIAGAYLFAKLSRIYTTQGFGPDISLLPFFMTGAGSPCTTACEGVQGADVFHETTKNIAFFGQATWNITDQLSITGGLRYSYDKKTGMRKQLKRPEGAARLKIGTSLDGADGTYLVQEGSLTWLASTRYFIIPEEWQVYFTASTGFKAPGITGQIQRAAGLPETFRSEKSNNYEVGTKGSLYDGRLGFGVSVFRLIFKDLQTQLTNPFPPNLGSLVLNAGKLRSQGVEADVFTKPFDWLTIQGSAVYIDSEYLEFGLGGPCAPGQAANVSGFGAALLYCDNAGRPPSQTPKWEGNLAVTVEQPLVNTGLEIYGRFDWDYHGWEYLQDNRNPQTINPNYSLFNLRLGLRSEEGLDWDVSLWVRNLTDRGYLQDAAGAIAAAFFGSTGSIIASLGPPRTIGIDASIRY
jgi:iron complex outermembrane receptor protein